SSREASPSANLSATSTACLYWSSLSKCHFVRANAAKNSLSFLSLARTPHACSSVRGHEQLSQPCASTIQLLWPASRITHQVPELPSIGIPGTPQTVFRLLRRWERARLSATRLQPSARLLPYRARERIGRSCGSCPRSCNRRRSNRHAPIRGSR